MREQYDRTRLLDEIWAEPICKVAPRYGLSDVGLKKLCARLQIPTPMRGHWAKVKAGRSIPPKPALKDFQGDPRQLFKPLDSPARAAEPALADERYQAIVAHEQDPANRIIVRDLVVRWHPLVAATRNAFQKTRQNERGLSVPHGKGIEIAVSTGQRARALRLANALIRALEVRGYRLVEGNRHVEVEMFGVRLTLSIVEPTVRSDYVPTEDEKAAKAHGRWSYWPRYTFTPSGRLEVKSDSGYGGCIRDSTRQHVEDQLNKLVMLMAKRALVLLQYREERAEAEALRETQRLHALAQKELQDAEQHKLTALRAAAQRWQEAQLIRAYVDAVEQASYSCGDGPSDTQLDYLRWARAKADWLDPLVVAPDVLLDQVIQSPY